MRLVFRLYILLEYNAHFYPLSLFQCLDLWMHRREDACRVYTRRRKVSWVLLETMRKNQRETTLMSPLPPPPAAAVATFPVFLHLNTSWAWYLSNRRSHRRCCLEAQSSCHLKVQRAVCPSVCLCPAFCAARKEGSDGRRDDDEEGAAEGSSNIFIRSKNDEPRH